MSLHWKFGIPLAMVFALGIVTDCLTGSVKGVFAISSPARGGVSLEHYLAKAGNNLDCYFTIERNRLPQSQFPLASVYIQDDTGTTTIALLVAKLRQDLPGMTVSQSNENPAVVHIIDSSLTRINDYVLQDRVNISYSGLLLDLPNYIGRQLNHRLVQQNPSIANQMYEDVASRVDIKANATLVRTILTDYVPLAQYSRVLWVAETRSVNNRTQTLVTYPGSPWLYGSPRKGGPIPFSEGQIAFVNNARSDAQVSEAIEFIYAQMRKQEPRQVRWAMLYLGKHKVAEGIPVLLKHLDYQYTSVPLVAEAYPALNALVEIGNPAATGALESLRAENNALRLELLCRVIIGVSGRGEGERSIRAVVAQLKDAAQQARVKAALDKVLAEPVATAHIPVADAAKGAAPL